jgi:ferredoxin
MNSPAFHTTEHIIEGRNTNMPKITVNGQTYEVEHGKRLVLALEDIGVPIGHRCGGNSRCTTCRVRFEAGEPDTMTRAEYTRLSEKEALGQYRLACQIVCDHDMVLEPLMTADNQPEWNGNTGPRPKDDVTPEAEWFPMAEFA